MQESQFLSEYITCFNVKWKKTLSESNIIRHKIRIPWNNKCVIEISTFSVRSPFILPTSFHLQLPILFFQEMDFDFLSNAEYFSSPVAIKDFSRRRLKVIISFLIMRISSKSNLIKLYWITVSTLSSSQNNFNVLQEIEVELWICQVSV